MVQVREEYPKLADGALDVDQWLSVLPGFDEGSTAQRMRQACAMAQQAQADRADHISPLSTRIGCFDAGLEMAGLLAELHIDEEALIAAVIYRAVREQRVPLETVAKNLGDEVAKLVEGVLRMAAISQLRTETEPVLGQGNAQIENIRKMLVAMVDDVRVGLIKLAERTQAIRAVKDHPDPEKQIRVAREVFDIYAPLAHRLGIGQIKWELEDISFRYLQPEAYKTIAKMLDGTRLNRQHYIDEVIELLEKNLLDAGIVDAKVNGRAKHIYSIWRKMHSKNVSFDEVYDIRAVRVLVPEIKDCYACLGVVHTLWRNIAKEFDDYIANPKENGYRSLHTAVIGPESKVLEVQIRTFDMHEEAELGVCAHWRYKGTDVSNKNLAYEQKLEWLRQVLEWHEEAGGDADLSELADELTIDIAKDRIYVFTPDGHVVDIAVGSTPVDFAYHIHTEVGHRCRGAKVDGRIVPLNTSLQNGQKVEIITGSEIAPNRDWMRSDLGYVRSARARSKIRAWFRLQARDRNLSAGRQMLERELKRMALTSVDYRILAQGLGYQAVDDLFVALGAGDISTNRALRAVQEMFGERDIPVIETKRASKSGARSDVTVQGVGNLLTHLAKCCKPVPGDDVVGYVSVGRGVTVHRQDCAEVLALQAAHSERVIEVSWGAQAGDAYPVDVSITAYDRTGLLRDISALLAAERVNVISVNTASDKQSHTASMRITIEIRSLDELGGLIGRINNLSNVISAERCH